MFNWIKNTFKSLFEKDYSTNEVFGLSRKLPMNYIERAYVDDAFKRELKKDSHVVIYGGSKQGKTSLRRNCLSERQYILVQCSNRMTLTDLFSTILKEAGFTIVTKKVTEGSATTAELSLKGNGLKAQDEQKTETTFSPLEIDLSDANDIVKALKASNFNRYIVVEDFHYLPTDTQKDFAIALKTIHEKSQYKFIIIGVWLEDNRLIVFNGDLTGRVISINADKWEKDDLRRVIAKGGEYLNIEFDETFMDELVNNCFDSVYIVQEVCNGLCSKEGISKKEKEKKKIGVHADVGALIKEAINKQNARYESFLTKIAEGYSTTDFEMYKWILYAAIKSGVSRLENGILFESIRDILRTEHPKRDTLNTGNITLSLNSLSSLQIKKGIMPIIIDYDQTNRKLNVVEKSFLIWLNSNNTDELANKIISNAN